MNSFMSGKKFFDDLNFPRGFQRSGDFTITEANLLTDKGMGMHELASGQREPMTADEQRFISVCRGEQPASSNEEKVWLKYLNRITQRRHIYTICDAPAKSGGGDFDMSASDSSDE
ncbi:DUF413 domain-containing protein [Gallaecimonas kandeliae]|uniref:DUF413 domain-containing protein n=1 Tax=Gallaecimonas kandeliae TaxID=3029055 RepID=UPI0026474626|nr:DUF413 domain-containing protein [Gallaecimonas kandeliae]WKE65337.1 DUF413 domain-containing protein [Gallaecimonas kandeliae]